MYFSVPKTIEALANNRLNPAKAARAVPVADTTMRYRIKIIRDETGLDPEDFWDMQKLVEMYLHEEEKPMHSELGSAGR